MEKLIPLASYPKVRVKVHTKGDTLERITLFLASEFVLDCSSDQVAQSLIPWLKNYAHKKWTPFSLPSSKTLFTQKAVSFLQRVPFGQVVSYRELAESIGHPRAARAIGNFCRGNLFPLLIPCHRVIPSTGGLGSFTPNPRIKRELLQFEGVI